jgi:hypothetical protein
VFVTVLLVHLMMNIETSVHFYDMSYWLNLHPIMYFHCNRTFKLEV